MAIMTPQKKSLIGQTVQPQLLPPSPVQKTQPQVRTNFVPPPKPKNIPTPSVSQIMASNQAKNPQPPANINTKAFNNIQPIAPKSYDELSTTNPGVHFDNNYNPIGSTAQQNEVLGTQGLPLDGYGNIDFERASASQRAAFGLPEFRIHDGVKMFKDSKSGQWINEPTKPDINSTIQASSNTPPQAEQAPNLIKPKMFSMVNIEDPDQNIAGQSNPDIKSIGKNIPKVNTTSSSNIGGQEIDITSGTEKFDARGQDTAGQLQNFLSSSQDPKMQELINRIHYGAQGKGKGAAYIGGFANEREANAAIKILNDELIAQGSPLAGKLIFSTDKGSKPGNIRIEIRGGLLGPEGIQAPNKDAAEGGVIDKSTEATTSANDFNQMIRDIIGQEILKTQQQKSANFTQASDALSREIPGVGETSPEQEAQVQRQLEAIRSGGMEQILRDLNLRTRGVSADLQNSGFSGSSFDKYAFEEGVDRPTNLDARGLMRELIAQENTIRDSVANRQNAGVDTLNKIREPEFPSNIPGVNQYQTGTFTPKEGISQFANLMEILVKQKGMDAQMATEIAKAIIAAESQQVVSPTLGSQLLGAGTSVAGVAAKAAIAK